MAATYERFLYRGGSWPIVNAFSERFKLTAGEIAQAVASATLKAQWRRAANKARSSDTTDEAHLAAPSLEDLAAARAKQAGAGGPLRKD